MDQLEGIADADAHLGRPMPLPQVVLPLPRWVEVSVVGPRAVEISWNLDDSRPDQPGRVALYAGAGPPPAHELSDATAPIAVADGVLYREAPLSEAQPSLRPVRELSWKRDGLHLRLTAQGPWAMGALLSIVQSVAARSSPGGSDAAKSSPGGSDAAKSSPGGSDAAKSSPGGSDSERGLA